MGIILSAVYQCIFVPIELFFIETDTLAEGGLGEGHKTFIVLERL